MTIPFFQGGFCEESSLITCSFSMFTPFSDFPFLAKGNRLFIIYYLKFLNSKLAFSGS